MMDWTQGQGQLHAGGAVLEWQSYGEAPADRPVIVMLHEGLGCVALWRDFPAQLHAATGLPIFVYSRAGYGQSTPITLPRPLDYMTREALEVLPEVLDQIGARQVILFGHSDGATISAEYAGRVADMRVRGLILMAPHFYHEAVGLQAIAAARDAFEGGKLREKMGKYHADPKGAFRGWADSWLHPDQADWDVSEVIDYFRVPALMIQGTEDAYGTLRQIREVEERSYAPVDMLVVEGARHMPHLEEPQQVLDAVAEFTARLVRIEAAEVVPA
jgi:pimeloyl-ACP methyl ester carboxylesterase